MKWAKVEATFLADAKFRRLSRLLSDERDFHAAIGTWIIGLSTAWHCESREIADEVRDAPGFDALVKVGILDGEGNIPASSWDHWFDPIERRRETEAQRQKRHRASRSVTRDTALPIESSRSVTRDNGLSQQHLLSSSSGESLYDEETPTKKSGNGSGDWDHRVSIWSQLMPVISELTGVAYPSMSNGYATSLVEDVDAFGVDRVLEVMRIVAKASEAPDVRTLAFGTRQALREVPKVAVVKAEVAEVVKQARKQDREFERVRSIYGPGGTLYGDPLPAKYGGKPWDETYT